MSQKGGRDISRGARHELEARDEGNRKMKLYFSLPPGLALRVKYRVRPAWLIKRLHFAKLCGAWQRYLWNKAFAFNNSAFCTL